MMHRFVLLTSTILSLFSAIDVFIAVTSFSFFFFIITVALLTPSEPIKGDIREVGGTALI